MASNVSIVNGFKPVSYLNGSAWDDKTNKYLVASSDATALYVGDLVKLTGASDSNRGMRVVTQAAAGSSTNIHVGVVVGFDPVDGPIAPGSENLYRQYRPASTAMYALVCDDPNVVFEIQENSSGGTPLASTNASKNADIVVGSGSNTTGKSGMQLDTSTVATTNTLPLKILGFVNRPDNALGSANQKVLVQINSHVGKGAVVGV